MKKLAGILLCLSLIFLLASCAEKDTDKFSYDDWAVFGVYLSGDIFSDEFAELLGIEEWIDTATPLGVRGKSASHDFGGIRTDKYITEIFIHEPGISLPLPKDIDVGAEIADLFESYGLENMSADEHFLRGEKVYDRDGNAARVTHYFYGGENKYPSATLTGDYIIEGEKYDLGWRMMLTFQIKKGNRLCQLSYGLDMESDKVMSIYFCYSKKSNRYIF
ncbi:MAG: hypothetical protein FWD39_01105 [Clostridiales bacterium]|nr:hypothetical protein [Clostridiales bacterium]